MNSQRLIQAFSTSLFFSSLLLANNTYANSPETKEQITYQSALAAYKKGDTKTADTLSSKLTSYSLYPYLELEQLKKTPGEAGRTKLLKFFNKHKHTYLAEKAHAAYLQKLAYAKRWTSFINQFEKSPLTSAYYQCYYMQAKINTKQGHTTFANIDNLWNVGRSQPQACDPVFAYWKKQGKLTADTLFERTWTAINQKNYKFAQYLQKQIKNKKHLASLDLFWKVKKDVSLISNAKTLSKSTPHNADIAAYAIRQLAIKQGSLALKTWLRDRKRFSFSKEQTDYLNVYFGNKFAKSTNYNPNALATLQKIDPNYNHDETSEWKVRQALISQNWGLVIQLISKMPKSLQQQNRWIYWLEVAKQKNQPNKYRANFAKIIGQRDYYGFLAAHTQNKPLQLNDQSQAPKKQTLAYLTKLDAVTRMKELFSMGDTSTAYREWRSLNKHLNKEQAIALGYLTSQWGWHIQGIRIAAKLKAWNELSIRFPKSENALFSKLAKQRNIELTWPTAIARQESAYNQYAQSSAGARGYMQLMPATAKLTAKKYEVPYKNKEDLFDPTTNISLGTAYLSQMLTRFGSKAYASAAYNAGPHRAERWLKSRGKLPLDIWIETIPFNETRHYVENILTYSAIYNLIEGKKAAFLNKKDTANLTLNR